MMPKSKREKPNPAIPKAVQDHLAALDATFESMFAFVAKLYDPNSGGFFRSIPERNIAESGCRLEATALAVTIIDRGGLLSKIPVAMRRDITTYIRGLQDAQHGFFEDPQEAAMPVHKRRGRALRVAINTLRIFGAEPLYPLPGANAAQTQTLDYLLNRDAFLRWTDEAKRVKHGSIGSVVNAQIPIIDSLPESQQHAAIEMLMGWLATEQNPTTGLWWEDRRGPYGLISNTYKVLTLHQHFHKAIPNADAIYRATLACMREQPVTQAIYIRNPLCLFRILEPHLSLVSNEERVEMIRISARNLRPFQTADGGYADQPGAKHGSIYGCTQAWISRDAMRHLAGLAEEPLPGGDAFLTQLQSPPR